MKIVRYQTTIGQTAYGRLHADGRTTRLAGEIFGELTDTGEPAAVSKMLAPLVPRDIICIGLNYRNHAAEGNQPIPDWPVVFMKNSGTLQHPGEPIILPRRLKSDAVDYECELAVVIGKECFNVSKADALQYVLGYTCANDVSARDWQMKYGGSTIVPGQDVRHVLPPWSVSCHPRRDPESERTWDSDDPERPDDAGLEHQRHDPSMCQLSSNSSAAVRDWLRGP